MKRGTGQLTEVNVTRVKKGFSNAKVESKLLSGRNCEGFYVIRNLIIFLKLIIFILFFLLER